MKKIKAVFVAIICTVCLCCICFAGCSDYSYVKGSFDYAIDEEESSSKYDFINFNFDVEFNKKGSYKVDYIITATSKDGKATKYSPYSESVEIKEKDLGESKTLSGIIYVYKSDFGDDYTVKLKINIYVNNSLDKSVGYAVGFGILGTLLLCGVIAFFVADRRGYFDKKDN